MCRYTLKCITHNYEQKYLKKITKQSNRGIEYIQPISVTDIAICRQCNHHYYVCNIFIYFTTIALHGMIYAKYIELQRQIAFNKIKIEHFQRINIFQLQKIKIHTNKFSISEVSTTCNDLYKVTKTEDGCNVK